MSQTLYDQITEQNATEFKCDSIAELLKLTSSNTNKINRIHSKSHTTNHKYNLKSRTFTHQFASVYYCRLNKLRDSALNNATQHFKDTEQPKICHKILELKSSERCIIVGTLYKEMKLKPSILDELAHTNKKMDQDKLNMIQSTQNVYDYISKDDTCVLEDEYGRVQLYCNDTTVFNKNTYVSGVVVALYGEVNDDNDQFCIHNIFYPVMQQASIPMQLSNTNTKSEYILLVSGLSIGHPSNNNSIAIELLCDYLTGINGNTQQQSNAAQISRIIIAGNTLHRFEQKKGKDFMRPELDIQELQNPLQQLDCICTQLCSSMDIHIMPGALDPANYTLPQQPLHMTLFPSAGTYNTFHTETNPCEMTVTTQNEHKLNILGCAGQNIADIKKYTEYSTPLELLQHTLDWCHLAPTAPDTLNCYPYENDDPFTIQTWPEIYFSANSDTFETKLYTNEHKQTSRLVMVPNFSTTRTAVLIDISNPELTCIPLVFEAK